VRVEVFSPDRPPDGDLLVIPSGLSAPKPVALDGLRAHARAGKRLLALGDGVAWLCAAELLPGAVSDAPALERTHVRVEGRATPFTWAIPAGRILALAGAPAHRYAALDVDVEALAARGRILLRYCDASGGLTAVDGRAATVAGLCDESGHVVGILGGVSHALDCALGRQINACLTRA
jgi:phosphoribosylformylglycinamidine (FGAM) synthase-like amidotransferase family enzyme